MFSNHKLIFVPLLLWKQPGAYAGYPIPISDWHLISENINLEENSETSMNFQSSTFFFPNHVFLDAAVMIFLKDTDHWEC